MDRWPDHDLSGIAVAQLATLAANRAVNDDSELFAELRRRDDDLIAACWSWAKDTDRKYQTGRVFYTQALLKTRWEAEPEGVRALIREFWYPSLQHGAQRVLESWLRDPRCTKGAWNSLLDQTISRESYDTLRAAVVARNLDLTLARLHAGEMSRNARDYLLWLLEAGVGDHKRNDAAASVVLQHRESWPAEAEAALWRGILRSALQGFTLRAESL